MWNASFRSDANTRAPQASAAEVVAGTNTRLAPWATARSIEAKEADFSVVA